MILQDGPGETPELPSRTSPPLAPPGALSEAPRGCPQRAKCQQGTGRSPGQHTKSKRNPPTHKCQSPEKTQWEKGERHEITQGKQIRKSSTPQRGQQAHNPGKSSSRVGQSGLRVCRHNAGPRGQGSPASVGFHVPLPAGSQVTSPRARLSPKARTPQNPPHTDAIRPKNPMGEKGRKARKYARKIEKRQMHRETIKSQATKSRGVQPPPLVSPQRAASKARHPETADQGSADVPT